MTPSPPIERRYDIRDSRWLAAGRDQARIRLVDSQPVSSSNLSRIAHATRSPLQSRPWLQPKQPQPPMRSNILLRDPATDDRAEAPPTVPFPVPQSTEFVNHFPGEPIGSPLVSVSLTKGMIAADFLADPPGTGLDMPSQTTVSWSKSFRKTPHRCWRTS
jgi:hypothetical protein